MYTLPRLHRFAAQLPRPIRDASRLAFRLLRLIGRLLRLAGIHTLAGSLQVIRVLVVACRLRLVFRVSQQPSTCRLLVFCGRGACLF